MSSAGEFIGMVSAHSAQAFSPTELELSSGSNYARHVADAVAALASASERTAYAERRSRELMDQAGAYPASVNASTNFSRG